MPRRSKETVKVDDLTSFELIYGAFILLKKQSLLVCCCGLPYRASRDDVLLLVQVLIIMDEKPMVNISDSTVERPSTSWIHDVECQDDITTSADVSVLHIKPQLEQHDEQTGLPWFFINGDSSKKLPTIKSIQEAS